MCNGSVSQDKACALVITELEAQDYAHLEMALGGTYEEGIEKFRLSRQAHANYLEQRARMPKWEWQRDERGKLRPAQFDPALKALFPLPGCRGKRAQAERLKRFSSFLIGVIRDEHSGWDEQQLLSQAEKRLEEMKRDGIPPELLRAAILWVPLWYDEHVSHVRKEASEKGHEAKKRNKPPPTSFSSDE